MTRKRIKRKKLTAFQRKQRDLERSINRILAGGSGGFKGISSVKGKVNQNLLKRIVNENRGSGLNSSELKSIYNLSKNFGGASKRTLKAQIANINNGNAIAKSTSYAKISDKLKNSSGGIQLGDPIADLLETFGYSPEEFDMFRIYRALERQRLKHTSYLDIAEGIIDGSPGIEPTYPFMAKWLYDHIEEFRKDEEY